MRSPILDLVARALVLAVLLDSICRGAVPGDEHWDHQFGPVGVNEPALTTAIWRGHIYVGGRHASAGNTRASAIASFDGNRWSDVGGGVSGGVNLTYVYGLQSDADHLYVGGWFTNAGTSGARYVAQWDGNAWAKMGEELTGPVFALRILGTNLYAGGIFPVDEAGSAYHCLARWLGNQWEMVGGTFAGGFPTISAIESDGQNIYVGGSFTDAGSAAATNVAQWNGSAWSALGSGINGPVYSLLYKDGRLLAGGGFTNATAGLRNLAQWNGNDWVPWFEPNRTVRDLATDGTNIFVGGDFTDISSQVLNRIARWDGATWSPLGAGVQGFGVAASPGVYKMAMGAGGEVVAAGNFNIMGGVGASHVARWKEGAWSGLGGSTSKGLTHFIGSVSRLMAHGTDLYAGGLFTEAGDRIVNSIARWDGTNWNSLGSGLAGTFPSSGATTARGLAFAGPTLYAGGNFATAGGVAARGFARWDGNAWSNVGDADATVRAVTFDGSALWVGGDFTNIGGILSPRLALHMPGGGWSTLGAVAGGNRRVSAIATDGFNVFVGGSFTSIDAFPFTNIAKWNGSIWQSLGIGVNNTVSSLVASNGTVYAGGTFTVAGGQIVNRVAFWDGSTWLPLGSGVSGSSASTTVSDLVLAGGYLYAIGNFTNAGGIATLGLARWDGTNWSAPFGSGVFNDPGGPSSTVNALASMGDDLFVGGQFSFAGDKPSLQIARWNERMNFDLAIVPRLIDPVWLSNGQFQFRITGTAGERYVIESATSLTNWTPRLTNSTPDFDFTDPDAANSASQAYRAVLR